MQVYQFHPAANIFPLMGKQEADRLLEDMKEKGVVESNAFEKVVHQRISKSYRLG